MLLTEYMVGRDSNQEGRPVVCLVVDSVLPIDCVAARSEIVKKVSRNDLLVEFVSSTDGTPFDWVSFPAIPDDVAEALRSGAVISVIDSSDETSVECRLNMGEVRSKIAAV